MNPWAYAAVGLVAVGALMLTGILAFLPQCGFGFNFLFASGCLQPITFFGINPNFAAGIALLGSGLALGTRMHFEGET